MKDVDIKIELLVEWLLLELRQNQNQPAEHLAASRIEYSPGSEHDSRGGQAFLHVVIVLDREADLFQVVLALGTAARFARRLHRRQEQAYQNANDGDNYE